MFEYLSSTSLELLVLVIFVVLMRRPVRRYCGPTWAYALWFIPLLRIWLPSLPSRPAAIPPIDYLPIEELPWAGAQLSTVVSPQQTSSEANSVVGIPFAMESTVLGIWLVGVLLSLGVAFIRYKRQLQQLHRCSKLIEKSDLSLDVLEANPRLTCFKVMGLESPLVTGLWRPILWLPADFEETYSRGQKRLIIQHELCHLGRHDLWALWALKLSCCLFWFHPAMYWMAHLFRLDQELACDYQVTRDLPQAERKNYGLALIEAARRYSTGPISMSMAAQFSPKQLTERIQMIKHKQGHAWVSKVIGVSVLSLSALFALTQAGANQSDPLDDYYFDVEIYRNGHVERLLTREILLNSFTTQEEAQNYIDGYLRVTPGEEKELSLILDWVDYPARTRVNFSVWPSDVEGVLKVEGMLDADANQEDLFDQDFSFDASLNEYSLVVVSNSDNGTLDHYRMFFKFYPVDSVQ